MKAKIGIVVNDDDALYWEFESFGMAERQDEHGILRRVPAVLSRLDGAKEKFSDLVPVLEKLCDSVREVKRKG